MEGNGDKEKNTTPFINEKEKLSLQDVKTGKHSLCMLEFWRKRPGGRGRCVIVVFLFGIFLIYFFVFGLFLCLVFLLLFFLISFWKSLMYVWLRNTWYVTENKYKTNIIIIQLFICEVSFSTFTQFIHDTVMYRW